MREPRQKPQGTVDDRFCVFGTVTEEEEVVVREVGAGAKQLKESGSWAARRCGPRAYAVGFSPYGP
jgi:hypothetical protein